MTRTPDRQKQVMDLCDRLLSLEVAEREALLVASCQDDPTLRLEVEALLESIEHSGEFLILEDQDSDAP